MIKYIIVDDETASHDNIKDYASNLSYLSFQKSCYNAFEALDYLNKHSIDLIFLDINMPKLSGLEFLKTLSNPPKIIITTAYKEFALEGYELNIDDYLLKPFNFSRFVKSVSKVSDALSIKASPIQNTETIEDTKIFIKEDKKYYQIKLKDILFLEAYGNYVKINMVDKVIVSHQTLTSFTHNLPETQFIRIHKSFIISIDKIELIEGNRIHLRNHKIPIGKMYKLNVNRLIK
ncbi:response regulator transcription factor [Winogradskyella psychrotolerans]|jgi:DNA-binding LytR/AlgR family response regulator|uniref:Two component transcriptional regulator, LytTR family n=5 Tax=Flavobacteriaceae TaxID=49546 RepID=A0A0N0CGC2_9FLAO|nr:MULTISPECIES: response regulator transcription factor [Flavobacteriaceae]KJD32807.1 transcriptional regulator [Tamlana sedimentorum]KOY53108.1 Two-component response regulator [Polaribacter dokdonensis DSW-5]MBC3844932.1 response regulator transcription factor [Winogradskyella echinorum]MBC5749280.1 response regulator transcription factor [Winogradskyella echinorum]MBU2921130.1 response regulator transcription factor [Winogradskyella psychrotolerans]